MRLQALQAANLRAAVLPVKMENAQGPHRNSALNWRTGKEISLRSASGFKRRVM
jgi:hypothetical protein